MNYENAARLARLGIVLFLFSFTSCGTVIQKPVDSQSPSFSGNSQDSGIKKVDPHGNGFVVDQNFIDTYNAMVGKYGLKFNPPLKENVGISDCEEGKVIDAQHMVCYLRMARWVRMAKPGDPIIDKIKTSLGL